MTQQPIFLLLMAAVALYTGKLWLDDLRAAKAGQPNPRGIPGAKVASGLSVGVAVFGALVILAGETFGEHGLGLSQKQSTITWLFGAYTLLAAIIEEVIFRGYLVIENRGRCTLWSGIFAASVLFAALHPFLWRWDSAGFAWTLDEKGVFSTVVVFATSLWLYVARFASWNSSRSLLPCIAAHAAKNAGVLAIKYSEGFVAGWW
jgi:membrane protease YdiL (CAAX protease family)